MTESLSLYIKPCYKACMLKLTYTYIHPHIFSHSEYVCMCASTYICAWVVCMCVCVCVSVKMITGRYSTSSTNYTPASCIHKQCNLCPIDLSNAFNRSTLWPPFFCLLPCSTLCSTRVEQGKPSKFFCTPRVPLNNESYLAMEEETRLCSQIRRQQFREPAKMSWCRRES